MDKETKIPTLVKAIKTGDIYLYHGEEKYENITTGAKGKIRDESAKAFFVIPVLLNKFVMDNPLLLDLIRAGGFKLDND